jgi:hypothetical protein
VFSQSGSYIFTTYRVFREDRSTHLALGIFDDRSQESISIDQFSLRKSLTVDVPKSLEHGIGISVLNAVAFASEQSDGSTNKSFGSFSSLDQLLSSASSLSENRLLEQRWPKNGRFKSNEGIKGINWNLK